MARTKFDPEIRKKHLAGLRVRARELKAQRKDERRDASIRSWDKRLQNLSFATAQAACTEHKHAVSRQQQLYNIHMENGASHDDAYDQATRDTRAEMKAGKFEKEPKHPRVDPTSR